MITNAKFVLKRKNIIDEINKDCLINLKICKNRSNKYYRGNIENLFIKIYQNTLTIKGDFKKFLEIDGMWNMISDDYIDDDILYKELYEYLDADDSVWNMNLKKFQTVVKKLEAHIGICLDDLVLQDALTLTVILNMKHPPIAYINRMDSCVGAIKNNRSIKGTTFCFGKNNSIYKSNTITIRQVEIEDTQMLKLDFKYMKNKSHSKVLNRKFTIKDLRGITAWKHFFDEMDRQLKLIVWKKIRGGENLTNKMDIDEFIIQNLNVPLKDIEKLERMVEDGNKIKTIKRKAYDGLKSILAKLKSNHEEIVFEYSQRDELFVAVTNLCSSFNQIPF